METKFTLFLHLIGQVLGQVIVQNCMSLTLKVIVHHAAHVKRMKAIANLMTNVYLVLFVDMTTANLNLAIQMKQTVALMQLHIARKS